MGDSLDGVDFGDADLDGGEDFPRRAGDVGGDFRMRGGTACWAFTNLSSGRSSRSASWSTESMASMSFVWALQAGRSEGVLLR